MPFTSFNNQSLNSIQDNICFVLAANVFSVLTHQSHTVYVYYERRDTTSFFGWAPYVTENATIEGASTRTFAGSII